MVIPSLVSLLETATLSTRKVPFVQLFQAKTKLSILSILLKQLFRFTLVTANILGTIKTCLLYAGSPFMHALFTTTKNDHNEQCFESIKTTDQLIKGGWILYQKILLDHFTGFSNI